ncbi:MAG TPA: glycosyltransferase [Mucilaginibacter sp.]|nr:glycosyltransferase [Mucilaginibacter sp.]
MELSPVKKILIITSGQPSLNPRLIKEADTLASKGHEVTVLYAYWNDWGTKFDQELIPSKKWKAVCVDGDPHKKKITYFFSRLIHKSAKLTNRKTRGKYLAELAIARSGYYLIKAAKKYPADIYIGHNLGALAATVKAAKVNKKPCGFDLEDLHRYEVSDDKNHPDVVLKSILENRYITQTNYLTASSPLIAEAYQQLFPDKHPVVLLNVFPNNFNIQQPEINSDGPIRLFWFSQTIGLNRGIQDLLSALLLVKDYSFELHLLGYLSPEVRSTLVNSGPTNIHFHDPMAPDELSAFASQFDIGFALEPAFSINNNLALSNKIFTYMQAGLAVVASDTAAQLRLLEEYPAIGKVYPKGNAAALADILRYYHEHRDRLLESRKAALAVAQRDLNWEKESCKLLNLVDQTLADFE